MAAESLVVLLLVSACALSALASCPVGSIAGQSQRYHWDPSDNAATVQYTVCGTIPNTCGSLPTNQCYQQVRNSFFVVNVFPRRF